METFLKMYIDPIYFSGSDVGGTILDLAQLCDMMHKFVNPHDKANKEPCTAQRLKAHEISWELQSKKELHCTLFYAIIIWVARRKKCFQFLSITYVLSSQD